MMRRHWSHLITENFSYKMVALFISLILWLTILGRRDFVMSKDMDIELITAQGYTVAAQTTDRVKLKLSGPRAALKKFIDTNLSQPLVLDISQRGPGVLYVDIPLSKIETPLGVKILGLRPNQIQVEVVPLKEEKNDEKDR